MADENTPSKADIDKAIKDAVAAARDEWEAETQGLKDKNKELLGKLREASGVKPEDLAAAEARADKAEAALAEANKQVKTLTGERDKAAKALEIEQAHTSKLLISDGLKSALLANGVKDEDFIDTLTAKFASGATIKAEGEARVAMIGDKALADAIKEWAGSDAGKKFVAAPDNSGGGAQGGGGTATGGKTMTRQQFDALDPVGKVAFAKEGGKVVPAAA